MPQTNTLLIIDRSFHFFTLNTPQPSAVGSPTPNKFASVGAMSVAHCPLLPVQTLLITLRRIIPLITKTPRSATAYSYLPYRKLPTVKSDDQIIAQPATHPIRAIGMLSPVFATSSFEIPASCRIGSQPKPAGRTLR